MSVKLSSEQVDFIRELSCQLLVGDTKPLVPKRCSDTMHDISKRCYADDWALFSSHDVTSIVSASRFDMANSRIDEIA